MFCGLLFFSSGVSFPPPPPPPPPPPLLLHACVAVFYSSPMASLSQSFSYINMHVLQSSILLQWRHFLNPSLVAVFYSSPMASLSQSFSYINMHVLQSSILLQWRHFLNPSLISTCMCCSLLFFSCDIAFSIFLSHRHISI